MSESLTYNQAYKAIFEFIQAYYFRKDRPDKLGSMLGDIQLIDDGKPADPAMWDDWLYAVRKVIEEK